MSEGRGECEHDTPKEIHDELWGIYRKYVDNPLKKRVIVKNGPYEYDVPGGKRKGAWVIIDLNERPSVEEGGRTYNEAVEAANALKNELNAVGPSVKARFEILRKASP